MKTILFAILFVFAWFVFCLILGAAISRVIIYFKYGKKDNRLWRYFMDSARQFKYGGKLDDRTYFILKDKFGNERYKVIIWHNLNRKDDCSIHTFDGDCILSSCNEKASRKMIKLLWKYNS